LLLVTATQPCPGKSSNLYLGFQCFSADTISNFLFATCFDQLLFPDFEGDIVSGIDIAMPTVTMAKFSAVFIWFLRYFPPSILMVLNPRLKGLVVFRRVSFERLSLFSSIKTTLAHLRLWKPRSRALCKTRGASSPYGITTFP
jgi:hypothetical protein